MVSTRRPSRDASDPLYGIRKLLLSAADNLDTRAWQRLSARLAATIVACERK